MRDPTLAQRLLDGDRRALARAITLVEDDRPEGWELVKEVYPHTGNAAVVGFTGPPGVGKSTLIGALTKARREAGRTVGVLSIDPSSPFTQGALLGDRIRLTEHFLDQGVFIRSMANRGALGGLSEAALQAALLLDAAGREDVFVETVGVGQAEIDIIDHADTIVLVLMPGSGDSIQALKAGVMEIPDVIVINKADHPLTDTMVREIRGVLSLANLDRSPEEARGALAGADRQDRGQPRRRASRSWSSAWTSTASTSSPRVSWQERRGRNLRNEVLAIATARMRRRLEEELGEDAGVSSACSKVVRAAPWTRRAPRADAVLRARRVGARLGAERARDHHLLDLVGALADREDLRVAVEAADRVLLDVAVAAVDLHGLLGAAHRQAAGLELRLGGGQREVAPGVLLAARPCRRAAGPASISVDMSASLAWIAWNFEIGLPNALRCFGVRQRLVERALREPDAHRGDADAADVEDVQELLEARRRAGRAGSPRARGSR